VIEISNDGAAIVSTNFFETEQAKAGKFFVSMNDRCFRLLLPVKLVKAGFLEEMKTGQVVEIEREGDSLAFWFVDGSDSPFQVKTNAYGLDLLPASSDAGRSDLTFAVYVDGPKKVLELPAKYLGERQ